jgi:hypothetical protein
VLLVEHSVVANIQLVDVAAAAAAAVFAPVVAVFDAAAAVAEMGACAVVGERVHVAQAGAYAEVSGKSVSYELSPMDYYTHAHSFEVILQPMSFHPRNIRRSREPNIFRNTTEDADLLVVLCLLPDLCALLAGELVKVSFFALLVLLAALLLDAIPVFAERV